MSTLLQNCSLAEHSMMACRMVHTTTPASLLMLSQLVSPPQQGAVVGRQAVTPSTRTQAWWSAPAKRPPCWTSKAAKTSALIRIPCTQVLCLRRKMQNCWGVETSGNTIHEDAGTIVRANTLHCKAAKTSARACTSCAEILHLRRKVQGWGDERQHHPQGRMCNCLHQQEGKHAGPTRLSRLLQACTP